MMAMQYQGYGSPDLLKPAEVPVPSPASSQLLVRVAASSVNPVDWKLHNGQYRWLMPVKFPSTPGFDLAGEIVEVGTQVTHFKPGDRIFAMLDRRPGGASAEYVLVGESAAARLPANVPAQEAAAIPLAGLTALQSLRDLGHLAAGKQVLIVGASGGVGHFAVQIAKSQGAVVTAVCRGQHADLMRQLGADHVIDYTKQSGYRGSQDYDIVLDLVVQAPLRAFFSVMAKDGVYVASLPSLSRMAAALLLPFVSKRRVRIAAVKLRGEDLDVLRAFCEARMLRPVVDRVFRLEELAAAHAYSQKGRAAGKIVVAVAA
jgi:2-desacetyl-2-hydroxyethyl bacteriochlorophyllide A dehydrogenase